MESAMVTEALELTFEEKDSSFSRALWSLIFWVLFNESCISHLSLSLSLSVESLCKGTERWRRKP